MKIRIGTRGSKLALWQAHRVAELLGQEGVETEIITIETKGDKIQEVSIAKIGSKGVFTEEIEEQLALGNIDIAVHSAKDMQSELPAGFELIAFGEREKENDVIVSHNKDFRLTEGGKPVKLGTSSTRRVATLRKYYPQVEPVSIRGNLQTRIRKMEEGACDALLLAYAGVHRMEYDDMIVQHLSLEQFTPAVGQGAIAIEVHQTLEAAKKEAVRRCVNHSPTETRLLAERAFLYKLQGGCSVPVYAFAQLNSEEELEISGGVIALDGQTRIHITEKGHPSAAESIGNRLAEAVISAGGAKILKEIKGEQGV
ncbi:hydroxymethylbilane synthase [Nafulsella turpanensis]|uniref:hydroxymethylbilane synthase n=1 Tax=Nafulsella turpanensis TaxID=1265690 RepID=UPI000346AF72|nr:hydroxymethylbilane synthase [Nafulsella turpanensis]